MAKRESKKSSTEKHTVEGHAVEIRKTDTEQELWIDGKRARFFATRDGYTMHADAYAPPHKSLLEAAKHYLKKQPGKQHAH